MTPAPILVRAPGRVNLIGEHTDYNEGPVLPFAIDAAVTARFTPRRDGTVVVASDGFAGEARFPAGAAPRDVEPPWARLVAAVVRGLAERGLDPAGFEARLASTVPVGGGLSSSAACSVAVTLGALAVSRSIGRDVPTKLDAPLALADLCREAEEAAFGVRCGLMDPFVILHARAGCLCLLDCRSRAHRHVTVDDGQVAFVIADSGVRRELSSGVYDERRSSCEEAARRLGISALRDADVEDVERLPERLRRRARHVVAEIAATFAAAEALERGDLEELGRLLDDSHRRLRDDFEVSCPELDALVERARSVPGVLGSRLTGAGCGGWTVTAARPVAVPDLLAALGPSRARVVVPSRGASC